MGGGGGGGGGGVGGGGGGGDKNIVTLYPLEEAHSAVVFVLLYIFIFCGLIWLAYPYSPGLLTSTRTILTQGLFQ